VTGARQRNRPRPTASESRRAERRRAVRAGAQSSAFRPRNRRLWLQRRLIPSMLLLLLTYCLSLVLAAPQFTIGAVDVTGASPELVGRIAALSDATGINIFQLRTRTVAARVATLPDVQTVTATPVLPNRLHVQIVPYVPVTVWSSGGHDYLVTGSGFVIKEGSDPSLPRIEDSRPVALAHGDHVDGRVLQGVAQLRPLLAVRRLEVAHVTALPDDTVAVQGASGWQALFGLHGDLSQEATILSQVVQRGINFQTLDLRPGASPYYR